MKKIISVAILFLYLLIPCAVLAAQRIVQLNLSGCAECNGNVRMEKILKKTKGVKGYINKGHGLLMVTFDDEITTVNIIINELKRGKLFVEGEVILLK